jgi:hypothetical protein
MATGASVDERLGALMDDEGVPRSWGLRARLAEGVRARVRALMDAGVRSPPARGVSWLDVKLCLRLELRARNLR